MIEMMGLWHWVWIGIIFAVFGGTTAGLFFLRRRPKITKSIIGGFLGFGVLLHFSQILYFEKGENFWLSFHVLAPSSICAISALMFPIIFFWGNRTFRDAMFFIGVLSGFMSIFYPAVAFEADAFGYSAIRFFTIHSIIGFCPIWMVLCNFHKVRWYGAFRAAAIYYLAVAVTVFTDVLLVAMGCCNSDLVELLTGEGRNAALAFGPAYGLTGGLLDFIRAITPPFMMTAPWEIKALGLEKGDPFYWPFLWMAVPGTIILIPLLLIIGIAADPIGFALNIRGKKRKLSRMKRR